MVTNPDTFEALKTALESLPRGTRVLVVPQLPPEREPIGTVTSYIVESQDLIQSMTRSVKVTKYVTANPTVNVREKPNGGERIVGSLKWKQAVVVFDENINGWYRIADGGYAGNYVVGSYLSDKPL
jgi:uncharacterized protein YgiM (DUF1202 family)